MKSKEIKLAKIRVQKLNELAMYLRTSNDTASKETDQTEPIQNVRSTIPAYKRKGVKLVELPHSCKKDYDKFDDRI